MYMDEVVVEGQSKKKPNKFMDELTGISTGLVKTPLLLIGGNN